MAENEDNNQMMMITENETDQVEPIKKIKQETNILRYFIYKADMFKYLRNILIPLSKFVAKFRS